MIWKKKIDINTNDGIYGRNSVGIDVDYCQIIT